MEDKRSIAHDQTSIKYVFTMFTCKTLWLFWTGLQGSQIADLPAQRVLSGSDSHTQDAMAVSDRLAMFVNADLPGFSSGWQHMFDCNLELQ
jgi:hypothetical protein